MYGDEVANGKQREAKAVGAARARIDRRRPSRAGAAAEEVRTHDEEPLGIKRAPGTDDAVPPATPAWVPVVSSSVCIATERVAYEHRVSPIGVERAIGLIGDLYRRERRA